MDNLDQLEIREIGNSVSFSVKVVPGSSRDTIAGVLGDKLKIKTSAPPEKGKANKSVIKILSNTLNISIEDIDIVKGTTSPIKELMISGLNSDVLYGLLKRH